MIIFFPVEWQRAQSDSISVRAQSNALPPPSPPPISTSALFPLAGERFDLCLLKELDLSCIAHKNLLYICDESLIKELGWPTHAPLNFFSFPWAAQTSLLLSAAWPLHQRQTMDSRRWSAAAPQLALQRRRSRPARHAEGVCVMLSPSVAMDNFVWLQLGARREFVALLLYTKLWFRGF